MNHSRQTSLENLGGSTLTNSLRLANDQNVHGQFSRAQFSLLTCGQFVVCTTYHTEKLKIEAKPLISLAAVGAVDEEERFTMTWLKRRSLLTPTLPMEFQDRPLDDHPGVMGVGSITSAGALSSFSSVRPSFYGTGKPDVSAPGSSVQFICQPFWDLHGLSTCRWDHCIAQRAWQAASVQGNRPRSDSHWKKLRGGFWHGRINVLKALLSLLEETNKHFFLFQDPILEN